MFDQLIAELQARVGPFDYSQLPATLGPFTPEQRYLLCLPVLKKTLNHRTFAFKTHTGKQVISTLPKTNGNTKRVEVYKDGELCEVFQDEREAFMVAELWTLVSEPTDALLTAIKWRGYVYLALMRNYSKHLNYLKHGRRNEPKHKVYPANFRDVAADDEDDVWLPDDMLPPTIENHNMKQAELELLQNELNTLITSAKQNREFSEQLESTVERSSNLIETFDAEPATIRFEVQRERRNYRDNESRKARRRLA